MTGLVEDRPTTATRRAVRCERRRRWRCRCPSAFRRVDAGRSRHRRVGSATARWASTTRLSNAAMVTRDATREVLGLRWGRSHFDTGRIEVAHALTAIGYRLEFSRVKTRTSRRNITVDADTMNVLAPSGGDTRRLNSPTPASPTPMRSCSSLPKAGPLHPPHRLASIRTCATAARRVTEPFPRSPPHPRQPPAARPSAHQGRVRTTRALQPGRSR